MKDMFTRASSYIKHLLDSFSKYSAIALYDSTDLGVNDRREVEFISETKGEQVVPIIWALIPAETGKLNKYSHYI